MSSGKGEVRGQGREAGSPSQATTAAGYLYKFQIKKKKLNGDITAHLNTRIVKFLFLLPISSCVTFVTKLKKKMRNDREFNVHQFKIFSVCKSQIFAQFSKHV